MSTAEKQTLFLPVAGLASQVDDKLLPSGQLVEVENAYFPKVSRAERRFGTSPLPAMANISQFGTHQGALVALVDTADPIAMLPTPTSTAWVRSEVSSGPIATAAGARIGTGLTKIAATRFNSAGNIASADVCTGGGYHFVAYLDAAFGNKLHFAAIETTTGHVVAEYVETLVGGPTYAAWRCAFVSGYAVCCYETSAGAVNFLYTNATTLATSTALGGAVALGGSYHGARFDLYVKDATTVSVVYPNASGNARCADFVPSTGTITFWTPQTAAAGDIAISASVGWMQDFGSSGKVALIAGTSGGNLSVQWALPTVGATRAATASHSYTPASIPWNVTGHTTGPSATGEYVVVWDNNFGGIGTTTGWVGLVSRLSGVQTNGPILYRGATLRSKTWIVSGTVYAIISYASSTDGTHFVVTIPAVTAAPTRTPWQAHFAVRMGRGGAFSSIANPSTGVYVAAITYVARWSGGGNNDTQGVQLVTMTYGGLPNTTTGPPKEALGSMFVPGGQLRQFDGASYNACGFAYPPEVVSLTPAAGGSKTSGATYWYTFCYARMDAQGKVWRSPFSIPQSVSLGGSDTQVTAVVRPLRLTGWTNVQIEGYVGAASIEDEPHKFGVAANDVTVDQVNLVDQLTDTAVLAGEPAYTTGGVLENQLAPGMIAIAVAQGRMFGISADDPQALWYTKPFTLDQGLGWNEDDGVQDVRDDQGPMRGLAVIDDKLLVFKDRWSYAMLGQGPDAQGNGGSYVVQTVTPGVGCSNPNAIAEQRDGVTFPSTDVVPVAGARAGIFLIDRGLTAKYVGSGVQRYVTERVVQAIFVSKLAQVRFYTYSGRTLVYDIINGEWSTFTGQLAHAAISWAGVPVYKNRSADRAGVEMLDGTVYAEFGSPYQMRIAWPDVQINQIRGYEGFDKVQLVGDLRGDLQPVSLALYADWSPVALDTRTGTATPVVNLELQYRAKVSAIRVVFTDNSPVDAGVAVNGITVYVNPKVGVKKNVVGMT